MRGTSAPCSSVPPPWTRPRPTSCTTSTVAARSCCGHREPLPASSCSLPSGRCGRAAMRSSPPTRGCSEDATTPTYASCRPPFRSRRSAPGRTRAAPAVLDALLPLCAALLALAFGAMLLRSFLRRRSGEKVLWGLGFLLFAVAAGCEALAQRTGWSPGLFRIYYLAGGVLTVAYLGAGSAWLLLPRRARDWLVGGLAVATAAAVVTVALAGVHAWHARLDRSWAPARELRTRGPRVPLGCRAQLARQPVPDRRCALFDRATAARAGEPLDRRRCT